MVNTTENVNLNEFLNENMLDFINSILESNYSLLLQYPQYKKLDKELKKLQNQLEIKVPKDKDDKLLEKYMKTIYDMQNYECSILYHLGMKFGINIQKLK